MIIITQTHEIKDVRIGALSEKVIPAGFAPETVLLVEKGRGTEEDTIIGEVRTVEIARKAISSIHKAVVEDTSPWDFDAFMKMFS